MIEAEWWDYENLDELADAVAGDVGFIVESALDARGSALIALPGGTTPLPIYTKLAAAALPWKKVTIIPTDDRLVPLDDPRSNIRAIAQTFLPTGARVFPISTGIDDYKLAAAGRARLQPAVAARPRCWEGRDATPPRSSPARLDMRSRSQCRRAVRGIPARCRACAAGRPPWTPDPRAVRLLGRCQCHHRAKEARFVIRAIPRPFF